MSVMAKRGSSSSLQNAIPPKPPPSTTTRITGGFCFIRSQKEPQVAPVRHALNEQGQLAGVVVAPLAGLAFGNAAAGRDEIPAVRAVVDAVENEALMGFVSGKAGLAEHRPGDGQAGGGIAGAPFAGCDVPQP